MGFHDFVKIKNTNIPRNSEEWSIKHDSLLTNLVKAMRQDLFGKEKNIDKFFSHVHLVGRKPQNNNKKNLPPEGSVPKKSG